MVMKADIARHLGITKVHAARLVKRGCPTTSLKAALQWRNANPPKRAPVNRPESVLLRRINQRAAEKSRKATGKPMGRSKGPPDPSKPVLPPKPVESGDSLLDVLNAFIHVHEVSLALFDHACVHNQLAIPARMSEHTRAGMARMQAEEAYRKEMQIRGVLVDKGIVFQTARQSIEAVLKRLRRMPIELGPQCNPQEPLRATKIMQREVDVVISAGAKEIEAIRAARNK